MLSLSRLPDYAKAALLYRIRDRDVLLLQKGVASWKDRYPVSVNQGARGRNRMA
jgi:hypothetical protein